MAVNLSGRQLLQADLCGHVSPPSTTPPWTRPGSLLELTETVFTQASRSFLTDLAALKARGVRFALDDFGTGFSSLAYLEQFPVDVVKIGPTFVAGLGKRTQDTTLVTAIVNLGHTLHLTVVAEGVESPDQLAALQDMGCDLVQGFHFARPSPAGADSRPARRHPHHGAQDRAPPAARPALTPLPPGRGTMGRIRPGRVDVPLHGTGSLRLRLSTRPGFLARHPGRSRMAERAVPDCFQRSWVRRPCPSQGLGNAGRGAVV